MLLDDHATAAQADAATEDGSDAAAVAAAVAALGPLDREALLLRVRGRSLAEIAETTGTTTAMVRVRVHRAATRVETVVGPVPAPGTVVELDSDRSTDEVVTDAELGITPMLHARLLAALAYTRGPAPVRWRRVSQFAQSLAERGAQLGFLGGVTGAVLLAAATLTGVG